MNSSIALAHMRPGWPLTGPATFPEPPHGERRRHTRHNLYFPITFSSKGGPGPAVSGAGITVNVSEGGALFVCGDSRLLPGMSIDGSIRAKSSQMDGGTVTFTAMVLRVGAFVMDGRRVDTAVAVAVRFDRVVEGLDFHLRGGEAARGAA